MGVSEPFDRLRYEREAQEDEVQDEPQLDGGDAVEEDLDALEAARENVFEGWPSSEDVSSFYGPPQSDPEGFEAAPEPFAGPPEPPVDEERDESPSMPPAEPALTDEVPAVAGSDEVSADDAGPGALLDPDRVSHEHAPGELEIPPGYGVLEGTPDGSRRSVGIVVSRFNGDVTSRLLARALEELEQAGVLQNAVTVMPVPGAFELPIAAMALARTRRYACIVALGCVVRGDTPHFDYVASEAASGLQLAALETGVPVSFGVLTLDRAAQAESRIEKGAEAVRTALEMADLFSHLRAAAAR
jgi:6,7-dimethyl-8-ribityllumazine synthase